MPGVEDYKAILFLVLIWHFASCPQELFQTRRYSWDLLEFDTEVLSHITENRQHLSHMLVAYTTKGGVHFRETWKCRPVTAVGASEKSQAHQRQTKLEPSHEKRERKNRQNPPRVAGYRSSVTRLSLTLSPSLFSFPSHASAI